MRYNGPVKVQTLARLEICFNTCNVFDRAFSVQSDRGWALLQTKAGEDFSLQMCKSEEDLHRSGFAHGSTRYYWRRGPKYTSVCVCFLFIPLVGYPLQWASLSHNISVKYSIFLFELLILQNLEILQWVWIWMLRQVIVVFGKYRKCPYSVSWRIFNSFLKSFSHH